MSGCPLVYPFLTNSVKPHENTWKTSWSREYGDFRSCLPWCSQPWRVAPTLSYRTESWIQIRVYGMLLGRIQKPQWLLWSHGGLQRFVLLRPPQIWRTWPLPSVRNWRSLGRTDRWCHDDVPYIMVSIIYPRSDEVKLEGIMIRHTRFLHPLKFSKWIDVRRVGLIDDIMMTFHTVWSWSGVHGLRRAPVTIFHLKKKKKKGI